MSDETPVTCSKCGENNAGPGGILCPDCKAELEARVADPWGKNS